ncbi:T-cell surface glycoprotein CD8 alpha chain, partial [Sigmodon hispidus]
KHGSGIKPTFLIYVSLNQNIRNDKLPSTKLSVKKNGNEYILTMSNFAEEDEDYYFCSVT